MKLKKFALRGLIALAVLVAVCMFFSRTVQTITTPKVQIITAEKGRFEEKLSYTAQVYFAETETITVDNPYGMEVAQTHIRPGDYVQAGGTIFTLFLPGYDAQKATLQAEYDTLSIRLMELDTANYGLPREAPQQELYDAMVSANAALNEAVYTARLTALQNGTTLPDDAPMPEEVQSAQTAYDAACAAYNATSPQTPAARPSLPTSAPAMTCWLTWKRSCNRCLRWIWRWRRPMLLSRPMQAISQRWMLTI